VYRDEICSHRGFILVVMLYGVGMRMFIIALFLLHQFHPTLRTFARLFTLNFWVHAASVNYFSSLFFSVSRLVFGLLAGRSSKQNE
jgi:hypothetical protein